MEINRDILESSNWAEFENNFEDGWGGNANVYCLADHEHHLDASALAATYLSKIWDSEDELRNIMEDPEHIIQVSYNSAARELYPHEKLWPGTAEDDPEFWREHILAESKRDWVAAKETAMALWKPEWGPNPLELYFETVRRKGFVIGNSVAMKYLLNADTVEREGICQLLLSIYSNCKGVFELDTIAYLPKMPKSKVRTCIYKFIINGVYDSKALDDYIDTFDKIFNKYIGDNDKVGITALHTSIGVHSIYVVWEIPQLDKDKE